MPAWCHTGQGGSGESREPVLTGCRTPDQVRGVRHDKSFDICIGVCISIGGAAVRGGKGNVRTLSGAQKFRSKSEIVYDFLKLNILNGKLKSGERIAVSDVAKILGISGIPIREALTKLEAEGLFDAARKKPIPTLPRRIIPSWISWPQNCLLA